MTDIEKTQPPYSYWPVSPQSRHEMIEIAREFREQPTRSEGILWQSLRGNRLCGIKFRRQQPIGLFVVDFYAPQIKLAVEVDGSIHKYQQEDDLHRQELLESLGIRFVRISAETVEQNLDEALRIIREFE